MDREIASTWLDFGGVLLILSAFLAFPERRAASATMAILSALLFLAGYLIDGDK